MPELPETETIARDLHHAIVGRRITSLTVLRSDVLRGATRASLTAALADAQIEGVTRRAKSIVVHTDRGKHLIVTPRFTGALLLDPTAHSDDRYDAIRVCLDDTSGLRYRDVRRLGTVALADNVALAAWSSALGPEPLDPALTDTEFQRIVQSSRRAVKTILMDQRRVAGIGNIYATEALWRACIHPARAGTAVSAVACSRLLAALRDILAEAVALRGTTFRDYQDAHGGRGGYAARLQAYGRADAPCPRCTTVLATDHALEGRRSVYCPRCQR